MLPPDSSLLVDDSFASLESPDRLEVAIVNIALVKASIINSCVFVSVSVSLESHSVLTHMLGVHVLSCSASWCVSSISLETCHLVYTGSRVGPHDFCSPLSCT